jgi:hypothetical protein
MAVSLASALVVVGMATTGTAAAHDGHHLVPMAPERPPVVHRLGQAVGDRLGLRGSASTQAAPDGLDVPPTTKAQCGPGSNPESGRQGRVPLAEVESGRAAQGYTCNASQVSHVGDSGGYKVERYVDAAGHECAFYDTTLLFPLNAVESKDHLTGVFVLDMTDPAKPVHTATLSTPAMQSPHESMSLNKRRGLLAAVAANPLFAPGVVDLYDVSQDCRQPALKASLPVGVLGHESGFAPDGNTFYAASLYGRTVTAVDVSNPSLPVTLGVYDFESHGLSVSDDGNRLYMAANGSQSSNTPKGLVILDTSDIQSRKPNPQIRIVSKLTWALVSTPQIAIPVTIEGHPYVVEIDEFAGGDRVGAARIIDIADELHPRVISNMRLEVNQAAARATDQSQDPGASFSLQGYAGHYCNVPNRVNPGIVACTFIVSGMRVFDIRDPYDPKEIAYFNGPIQKTDRTGVQPGSAYAMSSPSFVPERGEIWYSDGNSGFYAVHLTNGVWPFTTPSSGAAAAGVGAAADRDGVLAASRGRTGGVDGTLPSTGPALPLAMAGVVGLGGGLALRRLRRRAVG